MTVEHEPDQSKCFILWLSSTVQRLASAHAATPMFALPPSVRQQAAAAAHSCAYRSTPCLPAVWPLAQLQAHCRWLMWCVSAEPLLDGVAPQPRGRQGAAVPLAEHDRLGRRPPPAADLRDALCRVPEKRAPHTSTHTHTHARTHARTEHGCSGVLGWLSGHPGAVSCSAGAEAMGLLSL